MPKVYVQNHDCVIRCANKTIGEFDLPWDIRRLVEKIFVSGLREREECLTAVPDATDPQGRDPAYRFALSDAAARDMRTALRTVRHIVNRLAGDAGDAVVREAQTWRKALPKMNEATLATNLRQWRSRRYREGRRKAETMARCAAERAEYDGVVFERIVSLDGLRAAGLSLRNCLGNTRFGQPYGEALREGTSAFWTIRDADDDTPFGVVLVSMRSGAIIEARAYRNDPLPLDTAEALRLFCRHHAHAGDGLLDLGLYGGFVDHPAVVAAAGEIRGKAYEVAVASATVRITVDTDEGVRFGFLDACAGAPYYACPHMGRGLEAEKAVPVLLHALAMATETQVLSDMLDGRGHAVRPRVPCLRWIDEEAA